MATHRLHSCIHHEKSPVEFTGLLKVPLKGMLVFFGGAFVGLVTLVSYQVVKNREASIKTK